MCDELEMMVMDDALKEQSQDELEVSPMYPIGPLFSMYFLVPAGHCQIARMHPTTDSRPTRLLGVRKAEIEKSSKNIISISKIMTLI